MSRQYYYTINSLPHLCFGDVPPISENEFFARSAKELSSDDFTFLQSVHLSTVCDKSSFSVLAKWYAWETTIRNELVKRRASKLGLSAANYVRGNDHDDRLSRLVDRIFHLESPWMAEETLDKARWGFLENLEFFHHFDIEKLVIYFLKLQILGKRSRFDNENGQKVLTSVLQQAEQLWSRKEAIGFGHEK